MFSNQDELHMAIDLWLPPPSSLSSDSRPHHMPPPPPIARFISVQDVTCEIFEKEDIRESATPPALLEMASTSHDSDGRHIAELRDAP